MAHPRIFVIALGGTIASVRSGEGVAPGLTADALVEQLPGVEALAEVHCETLSRVPSHSLTFQTVLEIADRLDRLHSDGIADGVVITQGTDTLEETSFALELLRRADMPVVMTGAMRNPLMLSADGAANLQAAIRITAHDDARRFARNLGVLVVLNDRIHSAVDVIKANTSRPDAFASPNLGPVGMVIEDRIMLTGWPRAEFLQPARNLLGTKTLADIAANPKAVLLLTLALGDSGQLLEAVNENPDAHGYDGIVLAGMGGGHVPDWMAEQVVELAGKMPVVMTSRTGSGPLLARTYDGPGSEMYLRRGGVLSAGWLHSLKARILTTLLLQAGVDNDGIARGLVPFTR